MAAIKKLIATASKKNAEKVRKRLESAKLSLAVQGEISGEVSGIEALLAGHRVLAAARAEDALAIADALLAKVDDVVDIYLLRARALLDLEALSELDAFIGPLVDAAPTNRGVLMVAARYHYLLGEAQQSLAFAKRAAANDSRNVEALLHMELCYRYSGETAKAGKILQRCMQISGPLQQANEERFKQYSAALFRMANYAELDDAKLAELRAIHDGADDPLLATQSAYALATQYGKRKQKDTEIKHLLAANESECRVLGLEPHLGSLQEMYSNKLQRQRAQFDSRAPAWFRGAAGSQHAPVFVLGLPRSGTTLLEQILGGHSRVGQVGESKAFLYSLKQACRLIDPYWNLNNYPEQLERLSESALQGMVQRYEKHQSLLTRHEIYIDKELANFEYAGLMALLFPKARFIHMDRAPMDIFLSCFRNSIPGVPETTNFAAIAEYYIYMKRLIGHWRALFPERLMVVNYQSLVQEPEQRAQGVSAFLGLEYEPDMLEFHRRKNIVRTLSVDQVRKKIYSSSVEAWRAYSDVLAPAKAVLEQNDIPLEGVPYL